MALLVPPPDLRALHDDVAALRAAGGYRVQKPPAGSAQAAKSAYIALGKEMDALELAYDFAPVPAQLTWRPAGSQPLTDAAAAALVTHRPEQRPGNAAANAYVPTDAELAAYRSATPSGWTNFLLVTGRPGLTTPSTDDLIQWAAHKWGIPEDWVRAQVWVESRYPAGVGPGPGWNQSSLGDLSVVADSSLYPPQARVDANHAYQSMGIASVKWRPGDSGLSGAGTEPLRWKSTAFNLDFYAANVRYYFDGHCAWCSSGYAGGQEWNSVGAWFEPDPWGNAQQQTYIGWVQAALAAKPWLQ